MKQFKQYQTESLTKYGRENIKSKLNKFLPQFQNSKAISNQTLGKSKSTIYTNDNSKISKPSKEKNPQNNPIISKKLLLKKRTEWFQVPIMKVPQYILKPAIKLKFMMRQNAQF